LVKVDEEVVGGVAVAEVVQEGRAVWGWELVDMLFEL
jgi:hypothetical protein